MKTLIEMRLDEATLIMLQKAPSNQSPHLLWELTDLLRSSTESSLDAARQALEKKNFEALYQTIHRLKGACATMGLISMSELCTKGEELARLKDEKKSSELLASLLAHAAETQEILETKWKKKSPLP